MFKIYALFSDYDFTYRERRFVNAGALILAATGILVLLSYGVAPLFTGRDWVLIWPPLHILAALAGLILVWHGLRAAASQRLHQFDQRLSPYLSYRVSRWLALKVWGIVTFLVHFLILFCLEGSNSERKDNTYLGSQTDDEKDPNSLRGSFIRDID